MKQKILIILFLIFPINTFALVLGEDGLYEEPWIIETFKDLREDLEEANQEQKRFMILFEQKGCGYCKKMHEKVYSIPEIASTLQDDFFVIRINIFGDIEVTDFDGETLPEKEIVKKWGEPQNVTYLESKGFPIHGIRNENISILIEDAVPSDASKTPDKQSDNIVTIKRNI